MDRDKQVAWMHRSIMEQYLYMLFLCSLEFLFWHLGIQFAIRAWNPKMTRHDLMRISLAMIMSSFGKLLLIVLAIWDYSDLEHSWLINLLVFMTNGVALSGKIFLSLIKVLLESSRYFAFLILIAGLLSKLSIQLICASLDTHLNVVLF